MVTTVPPPGGKTYDTSSMKERMKKMPRPSTFRRFSTAVGVGTDSGSKPPPSSRTLTSSWPASPASRFGGGCTLPGDKSLSHRLAILGALAEGETRIGNFSTAADCNSTLRCLKELGVEVRGSGRAVDVEGLGPAGLRGASGSLDVGNSGSTVRMLAGVLAGRPLRPVLPGGASLPRPALGRGAEPLRGTGAAGPTTHGAP